LEEDNAEACLPAGGAENAETRRVGTRGNEKDNTEGAEDTETCGDLPAGRQAERQLMRRMTQRPAYRQAGAENAETRRDGTRGNEKDNTEGTEDTETCGEVTTTNEEDDAEACLAAGRTTVLTRTRHAWILGARRNLRRHLFSSGAGDNAADRMICSRHCWQVRTK
jgi:hypothetical protein